jgi:hypothetical protein
MSEGPYRADITRVHGPNKFSAYAEHEAEASYFAAELNRLHKGNSRLVAALTKDAERYGELEIGHYWVIRDFHKDWLVGRAMTLGDDRTVQFDSRYSTALEAVTELVRRIEQEPTNE